MVVFKNMSLLFVITLVCCFANRREAAEAYASYPSVCENSELIISCRPNEVLRIQTATYGRSSSSICNHGGYSYPKCPSVNVKNILQQQCDGYGECQIPVSNKLFNIDPCPGFPKYLQVSSLCVPKPNKPVVYLNPSYQTPVPGLFSVNFGLQL